MKFFAPLAVAIMAFVSQADANGVCYDPNHGTGMDANSVAADMQIIASHGFDSVRTFISKFGNTEIGPIVAAAGLKAMLGVPYPQSDYQEQMAAAIKAAQAGGVYAIMVGNENLAGAGSVPSDMISVIQSIKSQVPSGVLVGTVQRNTEVINHSSMSGWDDLVSNCDILGVNAHPFFNPGTTCDDAINVLKSQWDSMASTYGDKLVLAETGWPSGGSVAGNVGSVEGAEIFYNAYQQWSSSMSEKFYFQVFDTPYRSELFEQTFGILTYDGQNKFSMTGQQAPNTTQEVPPTEQQTYEQVPQTDAPVVTTAAPVPEATTAAPEATAAAPVPEATTAAPYPEATAAPVPEATTAAPIPAETPAVVQSTDPATTPVQTEGEVPVATKPGKVLCDM